MDQPEDVAAEVVAILRNLPPAEVQLLRSILRYMELDLIPESGMRGPLQAFQRLCDSVLAESSDGNLPPETESGE